VSKDPAFLFYTSDFLTGTMFMTNEQVGIYVRLLCAQHQHGGRIDAVAFNVVVGDNLIIRKKFDKDKNGFFNRRLNDESEKRNAFCESRRVNRMSNIRQTSVERMEDENEDENKERGVVRGEFEMIWSKYPNKAGKKAACRHFKATVKTEKDFKSCQDALEKYLKHLAVNTWKKPQNGSTWFNSWSDWVNWFEPEVAVQTNKTDTVFKEPKGASVPSYEQTRNLLDGMTV